MAVTLADIDRWEPSAVREVSAALGKRGASADEVKAGLSRLPLIASWQGTGGDAARASLDVLSKHLAAHADEMAAVASATNKAADAIEGVKEKLKGIYRDAQAWGFSINPATGEVTPTDKGKMGLPLYHLQQMELQERISKVLADANTADADLARAITMAGKTRPAHLRPAQMYVRHYHNPWPTTRINSTTCGRNSPPKRKTGSISKTTPSETMMGCLQLTGITTTGWPLPTN